MLYLKEMSKYLEFKRFKGIIYIKAKRLDIHQVELCIHKIHFSLYGILKRVKHLKT